MIILAASVATMEAIRQKKARPFPTTALPAIIFWQSMKLIQNNSLISDCNSSVRGPPLQRLGFLLAPAAEHRFVIADMGWRVKRFAQDLLRARSLYQDFRRPNIRTFPEKHLWTLW